MSNPATTAFNGGPDDKLKTVDVYEETTSETKNDQPPKESAFTTALTKTYEKSKEYAADVKARAKQEDVSSDEAKKTIKGALKGSKSSLDSVGESASRVIFGDIQKGSALDVPGGEKNYYRLYEVARKNAEGDDERFQIKDDDPVTVQSVMDVIQDTTGGGAFKGTNLEADAAILHGAIDQLNKWKVPELADKVIKDIKDKQLLKEVARRSAMQLANSGNIDAIESLIREIGPEALMSQNPLLPETLLRVYRFPGKTTPTQYPPLLTQLIWVLDQLRPGWLHLTRGEELIWNLDILTNASDNARLLLSTSDDHRTPALIARSYRRNSAANLLSKMYPMMPIVD